MYKSFPKTSISLNIYIHLHTLRTFLNTTLYSFFLLFILFYIRFIKFVPAMKYISIIHLRCIREVFSDALSSLPISGYFCIISAPTVTPAWLKESSHLRDRDVLRSCLHQSKEKKNKGRTSAVLIDICLLVNSQWKQVIPHSSAI